MSRNVLFYFCIWVLDLKLSVILVPKWNLLRSCFFHVEPLGCSVAFMVSCQLYLLEQCAQGEWLFHLFLFFFLWLRQTDRHTCGKLSQCRWFSNCGAGKQPGEKCDGNSGLCNCVLILESFSGGDTKYTFNLTAHGETWSRLLIRFCNWYLRFVYENAEG